MSEVDDRPVDELADVEAQLAVDPGNAETWYRHARLMNQLGQFDHALEACRRALSLWPDITVVYELQLRLAQSRNDLGLVEATLRELLKIKPGDPDLSSRLGGILCRAGNLEAAIPLLRGAVVEMGHTNDTLWNYTSALAATGGYDELIASETLLDRLAAGSAAPYPPLAHLAVARLSRAFDRDAVVASAREREASAAWLDPDCALARIGQAITDARPFSLVRIDYAMARFCCYLSLHAHRLLRPQEMSAMVNSVWEGWFGAPIETLGVLFQSSLERLVSGALRDADVIGVAEAEHLLHEPYQFGFLAEMLQSLPAGPHTAFASFHIVTMMHERLPYLRPLLSGLPFLGIVSPYPGIGRKLGHFCGIAETRAITVPGDWSRTEPAGHQAATGFLPEGHLGLLDELSVPFPGAVFLVCAPGPLAVAYCGRIKSLGGIAIDIGLLADRWAGRT